MNRYRDMKNSFIRTVNATLAIRVLNRHTISTLHIEVVHHIYIYVESGGVKYSVIHSWPAVQWWYPMCARTIRLNIYLSFLSLSLAVELSVSPSSCLIISLSKCVKNSYKSQTAPMRPNNNILWSRPISNISSVFESSTNLCIVHRCTNPAYHKTMKKKNVTVQQWINRVQDVSLYPLHFIHKIYYVPMYI